MPCPCTLLPNVVLLSVLLGMPPDIHFAMLLTDICKSDETPQSATATASAAMTVAAAGMYGDIASGRTNRLCTEFQILHRRRRRRRDRNQNFKPVMAWIPLRRKITFALRLAMRMHMLFFMHAFTNCTLFRKRRGA